MKKVRLKIAVSGTQGTGKTTSVYKLAYEYKVSYPGHTVGILCEVARDCPFPINQHTTVESQMWIFIHQMEEEYKRQKQFDILICDRTIMDSVAYTEVAGMDKLVDCMMPVAQEWCKTYNHIYVKKDEHCGNFNLSDGVRDTDVDFRHRVEQSLIKLYNICGVEYSTPTK